MKYAHRALLICALFGLVSPKDRQAKQLGTSVIAGRIVSDGNTPRPISEAIVTLKGDSISDRSAITTVDGLFEFVGLPSGHFTVTVAKAAYLETSYGAATPTDPGTAIALGQDGRSEITIQLPLGAILTGIVRSAASGPLSGVEVAAYRVRGEESRFVKRVRTDDHGMYRIFGLVPGDYVLQAMAPSLVDTVTGQPSNAEIDSLLQILSQRTRNGSAGMILSESTSPGIRARSMAFAPIYFPGVLLLEDAAHVPLATGEERPGLDFFFDPVTLAKIGGRVTGPVYDVTTVQLSLQPRDSVVSITGRAARSAPDGTFIFDDVRPGHYVLLARAAPDQPNSNQRSKQVGVTINTTSLPAAEAVKTADVDFLYATAPIDVRADDRDGLLLVLQPGGSISGRTVFASADANAAAMVTKIRVQLSPANMRRVPVLLSDTFSMSRESQVRMDGSFEVKGIGPGVYNAKVSLPAELSSAGWWPRSLVSEGRDLLDLPTEVTPGLNVTDAVLTLARQHTELSGVLYTADGRPATEYLIVVFSQESLLWNVLSRRTQAVRPATDGHYQVGNLPAGRYFVAATTQFNSEDLMTTGFFERLASSAVRITLAEGEHQIQNLRIAR